MTTTKNSMNNTNSAIARFRLIFLWTHIPGEKK